MRKKTLIVVLTLLLIAVVTLTVQLIGKDTSPISSPTNGATEPVSEEESATEPVHITITDYDYSESVLTIKIGTSVTFTNEDSVRHSATADDGSFNTGLIGKGVSKTMLFDKVGEFPYHCTPHPDMTAKIIVTE